MQQSCFVQRSAGRSSVIGIHGSFRSRPLQAWIWRGTLASEPRGPVADNYATFFRGVPAHAEGPWSLTSGYVSVGVSIGVAAGMGGEELDELLRQADSAMYAAKAGGQGPVARVQPRPRDDDCAHFEIVPGGAPTGHRGGGVHRPLSAGDEHRRRLDERRRSTGAMEPSRTGLLQPCGFLGEAGQSGHVVHIDRWVYARP